MTRQPNHHASTRLRFIGALPHNDGMMILARIEACHGPAGWVGIGRVLKMPLTDANVAGGDFAAAVARSTDREREREASRALAEVETPLFD